MYTKREPVEVRLNKHIDKSAGPDACWLWTGAKSKGYGSFWDGEKYTHAHRAMYCLIHGPLPEDVVVRHTCDNRPCCNPKHLVSGSQFDNVQDMIERGRQKPTGSPGARNPKAKLTEDQVIHIKARLQAGATRADLAREYAVDWSTIHRIFVGARWKSILPEEY